MLIRASILAKNSGRGSDAGFQGGGPPRGRRGQDGAARLVRP